MSSDEDLTAVWRTLAEGIRFQNYRSVFTILDVPMVNRQWIKDAQQGRALQSEYAPKPRLRWNNSRKYTPLINEASSGIRITKEQTNLSKTEQQILNLFTKNLKIGLQHLNR